MDILKGFSSRNNPQNKCDDISKKHNSIRVTDFECPECGTEPCDENYKVGKDTYPKIFNSYFSASDLGHFYYWDELHTCKECDTRFWFESGN